MHRTRAGYVTVMIDNGQNDVTPGRTAVGNRRPRWRRFALGAAALSLVVVACDGDDDTVDQVEDEISDIGGNVADAIEEFGEDSVELAARNLASIHGTDEFADTGYSIDGDLECTADATEDLTAVDISCGGATEDGSVAALTGTTTELPGASLTELEGTFVGLIAGDEVFRTDALG